MTEENRIKELEDDVAKLTKVVGQLIDYLDKHFVSQNINKRLFKLERMHD